MRAASPKGDLLLRTGAVITVIGLACALVAMTPLVVPSIELPGVWWFFSMLTGVGLALVILGLLRSSRARRAIQIQKVQH
jgi:hypothetical protein